MGGERLEVGDGKLVWEMGGMGGGVRKPERASTHVELAVSDGHRSGQGRRLFGPAQRDGLVAGGRAVDEHVVAGLHHLTDRVQLDLGRRCRHRPTVTRGHTGGDTGTTGGRSHGATQGVILGPPADRTLGRGTAIVAAEALSHGGQLPVVTNAMSY